LSNRVDEVKGRRETSIDGGPAVSGVAVLALPPTAAVPAALAATPPLTAPTLVETARDAQIPDLAATTASVNQLQSLASATSSSLLSAPSVPFPTLPTTQQQTQAQQSASQAPFKQDFYADGDDGANPLGG
jgi:hypothetical protein